MTISNTDAPPLRDGHVSTVVGLRNIPEAIRSVDTFDNPDYVDLFTVTTSRATEKSPEQWARAVLESTPLGQQEMGRKWEAVTGSTSSLGAPT